MLAACAARTPRQDVPAIAPAPLPETVRVMSGGRILDVGLEEYVLGTALAEVGPAGESPETAAAIFRLQAILARTYAASHLGRHRAAGFDLCDTTHCQVYDPQRIRTSRFSAIARKAVDDTAGQALVFNQHLSEALFHADCGGHTAAAEAIWGGRVPYLIGAPDPAPEKTHSRWQFRLTRTQLREALNANPQSTVGAELSSIRIVERDTSGRATRVELAGEHLRVVRGEQLRAAINQTFGARAIRSTRFDLTEAGGEYRFDGTGFGHGVGLCQVGAAARLRRGESVAAVLSAYYPGVRLTRLGR